MSNNEIPEGFNMTELGALPKEWGVKTLVDIATLQRGKDLPKQNQIPGPYPIVGSSGIIGCHNRCVCAGPGVITGRSGSIGKLIYVEKDYWPHNTCLYVKDFHANNPKFIYYLLHLLDFKKYATGVSVPTLNRNSIHSALLPIPPLPEQHRIAAVLSAVQDVKEKTGAVIAAAKSLKKSLMCHLFTYGPVPAGATESVPLTETEIGLVPEGWGVVRLGDVAEFSRKSRSLNINKCSKIPFIPMEYIPAEEIYSGEYDLKNAEEIKSGTFFFKGDLLVAKITPSFENGKQCIVDDIPTDFGYATTEVWPLRETNAIKILYLFYYLKRHNIRSDIAGKMEGSTGRQRVPKNVLKNVLMSLPPLPTQQKIAYILSTVDKKIEAEENKKKALNELFKSLLHNLMTAKIRVNHPEAIP